MPRITPVLGSVQAHEMPQVVDQRMYVHVSQSPLQVAPVLLGGEVVFDLSVNVAVGGLDVLFEPGQAGRDTVP